MSREQRQAVDRSLRAPRPDLPPSITERRKWFEELMGTMKVPGGIKTSPTRLGQCSAMLVEPERDGRPGTILYFHGGSFMLGSPRASLSLTGNLAIGTRRRSISIDYRLAPEHPFPAAIEDGVAAYRELIESGESPASIAFAGDSAGGGLAVTTCLAARRAGLPLPAAIVGFSPGLDATRSGESMTTKDGIDPLLSREMLVATGPLYVGNADPTQELLSPATVADLTGFPPMLLQVGTNEILLDDAVRLANRARDQGVDVILDVTANVPHVFQLWTGQLDEADRALARASFFLAQHLA